MDYACQYVRAVYDSQISAVTFDPDIDRITLDFSGKSDMETSFYLFIEENGHIESRLLDVPALDPTTQVVYDIPGPLDHIVVSPDPASVIAGATQQFTAQGYDANNRPVPELSFDWSLVNGGGSIETGGFFTAGAILGTYSGTVVASNSGLSGAASIQVNEATLDHFLIQPVNDPRYPDDPFALLVEARDADDNLVVTFNDTAVLTDTNRAIQPGLTSNFNAGVWKGDVTIFQLGSGVQDHRHTWRKRQRRQQCFRRDRNATLPL